MSLKGAPAAALPNNTLERAVRAAAMGAAGAREIVAPATCGQHLAPPAQRGP